MFELREKKSAGRQPGGGGEDPHRVTNGATSTATPEALQTDPQSGSSICEGAEQRGPTTLRNSAQTAALSVV